MTVVSTVMSVYPTFVSIYF